MCKSYTIAEVVRVIHKRGYKLYRVYLSARHRVEVRHVGVKIAFDKLVGVIDAAYERERIRTKLGAYEQRLRIGIAYASYRGVSLHFVKNVIELGSKG